MRRIIFITIFAVYLFLSFGIFRSVYSNSPEQIVNARVTEVQEIAEKDGLVMQTVQGEILSGEHKGSIKEIQVPLDSRLTRPLRVGDRVKVNVFSIRDDTFFQFYDFQRSSSYIWAIVLFGVLLLAFVGTKGAKRLFPSMIMLLLLVTGIIPMILPVFDEALVGFFLLMIVTALTTWLRLKNKLLVIIVTFSVLICLLAGYLIFVGFAQMSYVEPFVGSVATIDDEVYGSVLEILLMSVIFIPAGAVINASIQLVKYLIEEFEQEKMFTISVMLKEGLRISQNISAGELNNLIMVLIGGSIAPIYLIREQYAQLHFYDHGWVALQIIYLIAAGVSILLVTPVTVLMLAGISGIDRWRRRAKGGQRRLGEEK